MDRLLGNPHLVSELPLFYRAMAAVLLRGNRRPVVVVDWTEWREGFHALTAAVPVGGKCIPIFAQVYPERRLASARAHLAFLRALARVLPPGAVPIIVTDGGFKNGWMDAVERLGWDYVGRVRGNTCVMGPDCEQWASLTRLHRLATRRPKDMGLWLLGKVAPRARRIVTYFKPPRKRPKPVRWRRKPGQAKRRGHANNTSTNDQKYRKAAAEPWVLATSLTCSAREVVRLYRSRMQTEETYRGLKSHAYGWSFEDSRSTTARRLAVLFLIGALAMLVASIVGYIAESRGLHRTYQASTRRKRALSWFYLGVRILARQRAALEPSAAREGIAKLVQEVKAYAPSVE
jgi:hypothetical protein